MKIDLSGAHGFKVFIEREHKAEFAARVG